MMMMLFYGEDDDNGFEYDDIDWCIAKQWPYNGLLQSLTGGEFGIFCHLLFPTGAFEFSRFGTFWFAIFCHLPFPCGAFEFKDSKIWHILVWLAAGFGLFCHLLHSSSRVDIRLVWSVWGWGYFQISGHYMVANIRSFNSDSWTLHLTDRGSKILSFLWSNFLLVTFPNF